MTPNRYVDRDAFILEVAAGKRVLHLGCVGHTDLPASDRAVSLRNTLHWKLTQAADVVGVDLSADVIAEWRHLGFDLELHVGDVQQLGDLELTGLFDVIVAADIIEHISCPGAMLDGIKRFLLPGSEVVVTTPNSFGLPNYLRFLMGTFTEGEEHVLASNHHTLSQLLNRHGYTLDLMHTGFQQAARRRGGLSFVVGRRFFDLVPRLGGTLIATGRLDSHSE